MSEGRRGRPEAGGWRWWGRVRTATAQGERVNRHLNRLPTAAHPPHPPRSTKLLFTTRAASCSRRSGAQGPWLTGHAFLRGGSRGGGAGGVWLRRPRDASGNTRQPVQTHHSTALSSPAPPAVELVQRAVHAGESRKVEVDLGVRGGRRRGALLRRLLRTRARGEERAGAAGAVSDRAWLGRGSARFLPSQQHSSRRPGARLAWWMESMSGAPCGGCSRYAPRSAGDMPAVAAMNWARKEPSPGGGRERGEAGCCSESVLSLGAHTQPFPRRHSAQPPGSTAEGRQPGSAALTDGHAPAHVAQRVQQADGAARVADGLLHVDQRGADLLPVGLDVLLLCGSRQTDGGEGERAAWAAQVGTWA